MKLSETNFIKKNHNWLSIFLFIVGLYVLRAHFHFNWLLAIVISLFGGFFIAAFILYPFAVLESVTNNVVTNKVDETNKKIDKLGLQLSTNLFKAHFRFIKSKEESWIITVFIQNVPRVGDKLFITEIESGPNFGNPWVSAEEFEKIEKLKPDVFTYKWSVEEVIWKPFANENFVQLNLI